MLKRKKRRNAEEKEKGEMLKRKKTKMLKRRKREQQLNGRNVILEGNNSDNLKTRKRKIKKRVTKLKIITSLQKENAKRNE